MNQTWVKKFYRNYANMKLIRWNRLKCLESWLQKLTDHQQNTASHTVKKIKTVDKMSYRFQSLDFYDIISLMKSEDQLTTKYFNTYFKTFWKNWKVSTTNGEIWFNRATQRNCFFNCPVDELFIVMWDLRRH